ncbi:MAG TPA: prolyl oligopeptidase family serine peptidase [Actinomycetota bacterium]|nr:prolyl oligopeptidase family serine peptidase [Actinomycetota bacterium]
MRRPSLSLSALLCVLAVAASAAGVIPEQVPDLPVLVAETEPGRLQTSRAADVAPAPKTVDGDVSDWKGTPTRLGGTAIYSAGEYVYSDFTGDDFGADDGHDRDRLAKLDPLRGLEPRTYKADPLGQVLGDEFGVGGPLTSEPEYGDAAYPQGLEHQADIAEARVAATGEDLFFLVRTTQMTTAAGTAALILIDTAPGGSYPAPGGLTTVAEIAIVAAGNAITTYMSRGALVAPPPGSYAVVSNPSGFTNAIEIRLAKGMLQLGSGSLPSPLPIAIATGIAGADGKLGQVATGEAATNLINVAFRDDEPVRIRMDREQALTLLAGTIDRYLASIEVADLLAGRTDLFTPGPGYYERGFISDSPVVRETYSSDEPQGIHQHYGLYIPTTYASSALSRGLLWLHPRSSGTTHLAAGWVPGIISQLGEDSGRVVLSPSARGASTWYVGRGHESFLETWEDAMSSWRIDPDRVAVTGHSMGGFGSYLVGLLYPDRFSAAFPIAGPVTQGAWLGAGDPLEPQNGGNVEAEFMFNIVENARNLPYIIFQGTDDELVWVTGVTRMASRFTQLGYRNRLYLLLGQEHYSPLIVDEWSDPARYINGTKRDPNPARVTYRIWPALERAVETIGVPEGATLDYAFDGAYWVDGLTVREGDPNDPAIVGTFDATTQGRGVPSTLGIPEGSVAAVGHTAPFVMGGLAWLGTGSSAPANAFNATLTNIAGARLDLARMALSTAAPITATITTDGPAVLRLAGVWASAPAVTGAQAAYAGGVLEIAFAAGTHTITIAP